MHLQRKIIVFPEGTNFANALVSVRLDQTVCYAFVVLFGRLGGCLLCGCEELVFV